MDSRKSRGNNQTRAAKVLIVDDDQTLLRFLKKYLERENFDIYTADQGKKALQVFYQERPDIVVLDVMMPGMDGWEVCARLRELADTPIIMLTAKTSESEKLRGFRLGADDYVTKPFSMAELAARIRAVLTRVGFQNDGEELEFKTGALRVNLRKREVFLGERIITLTPTEFRLLTVLIRHAGEAVSRDELIREVWGDNRPLNSSALRRYIWLLRQEIEDDPNHPKFLRTVRGYGYCLEG
jgi:DNA-binding response OmpR family regulator